MLRPNLNLLALLLIALSAAPARAAVPEIAAVALGAPADLESARALQVLTLQALQERGLATLDPPRLQTPIAVAEAGAIAAESGAQRLFVLELAPLDEESIVAALAEVDAASGVSRARSSLVIDTMDDADRVLGRLVQSVLDGVPIDDTARIETVTEHEGHEYAKRPGEFLWGLSVSSIANFGGSEGDGAAALWGGRLNFLYEIPYAQFGARLGGGGSEDGALFELTVNANWMILDGDISPFVGGGLGLSALGLSDLDGGWGGHALVSGGVEFFRLHSARLTAGVDLLLPFYSVEQSDLWDDGEGTYDDDGHRWTPALMVSVGVLW